jgi:hypothetical protein
MTAFSLYPLTTTSSPAFGLKSCSMRYRIEPSITVTFPSVDDFHFGKSRIHSAGRHSRKESMPHLPYVVIPPAFCGGIPYG